MTHAINHSKFSKYFRNCGFRASDASTAVVAEDIGGRVMRRKSMQDASSRSRSDRQVEGG